MDMPKRKLGKTTGRNRMCGVFKLYAISLPIYLFILLLFLHTFIARATVFWRNTFPLSRNGVTLKLTRNRFATGTQ